MTLYLNTSITFILFFIEAIIHFTIGADNNKTNRRKIKLFNSTLYIPDTKDLSGIVITVLLFSFINSLLTLSYDCPEKVVFQKL